MFAKLSDRITKSSLWDEDDHIVRVWIAFLAEKDSEGYVKGTHETMRRISNVHNDPDGKKYDEAIKVLESPDPESTTKDYEGRRIQKVDGGWIVLNHEKYRTHDDILKEQNRQRVRRWREKLGKGKTEEAPANPEPTAPDKPPKPGITDDEFKKQVLGQTLYPEGMLIDFFNYWSERTKSGKKMRWELEKTWDLSRRLATWEKRSKQNFDKPKMTNYLGGESQ